MMNSIAVLPADSLLRTVLNVGALHHEDMFALPMQFDGASTYSASQLLGLVLAAFMTDPPKSVTRMMSVRNVLVKPFGLRTASLGCPVSSLASTSPSELFLNQFPVLAQHVDAADDVAQVILGADDKHLKFRACVAVRRFASGGFEVSLANRVQCRNWFGRAYLLAIEGTHRRYVGPIMLAQAVRTALRNVSA